MTEVTSVRQESDRESDLHRIVSILWKAKWLIAGSTLLGAIGGVAYALVQPNVFRAEAVVQPRQAAQALNGLGSLAAQISGVQNLGLALGGGSDRDVAMATLRSRAVVNAFIAEFHLLPKIYESKWDKETNAWRDPDVANVPTSWEAYNDFTRDIFKVSEDRRTGLVTVAIEWTEPEEAQRWVTELIARTNAYLKERAIQEGERNLAYLAEQSRAIGQVELRQALYGLVEEELKKMMVARGGDEFAFKTIDAAVVPMQRVRPNRAQLAIVGLLLGGMLGVAVAVIRAAFVGANA